MVTHRIKHLSPDGTSSTHRVVASRVKGSISGKVKPVRSYYELEYEYSVNPMNGAAPARISSRFPSGTYNALSSTPAFERHRFLGWCTQANDLSNEYAVISGDQKISSDNVDYHLPAIYGNWQAATNVTLVSQMPDWDPEMDHDCYVGQPYGELPEYAGSGR